MCPINESVWAVNLQAAGDKLGSRQPVTFYQAHNYHRASAPFDHLANDTAYWQRNIIFSIVVT